jgi:superfamily II DNA helicase RecQ
MIAMQGVPKYGRSAFRPAYGKLSELRTKLKRRTPFQALSGTLPPHILRLVIDNLQMDEKSLLHIKLTSDRPNTTYWTHRLEGPLSDFSNLDFLVPKGTGAEAASRMTQVLVFYDDRDGCARLAGYLNDRFDSTVAKKELVRHYHSQMSPEYLLETFEMFVRGEIKVLVATEAASTVGVLSRTV